MMNKEKIILGSFLFVGIMGLSLGGGLWLQSAYEDNLQASVSNYSNQQTQTRVLKEIRFPTPIPQKSVIKGVQREKQNRYYKDSRPVPKKIAKGERINLRTD